MEGGYNLGEVLTSDEGLMFVLLIEIGKLWKVGIISERFSPLTKGICSKHQPLKI